MHRPSLTLIISATLFALIARQVPLSFTLADAPAGGAAANGASAGGQAPGTAATGGGQAAGTGGSTIAGPNTPVGVAGNAGNGNIGANVGAKSNPNGVGVTTTYGAPNRPNGVSNGQYGLAPTTTFNPSVMNPANGQAPVNGNRMFPANAAAVGQAGVNPAANNPVAAASGQAATGVNANANANPNGIGVTTTYYPRGVAYPNGAPNTNGLSPTTTFNPGVSNPINGQAPVNPGRMFPANAATVGQAGVNPGANNPVAAASGQAATNTSANPNGIGVRTTYYPSGAGYPNGTPNATGRSSANTAAIGGQAGSTPATTALNSNVRWDGGRWWYQTPQHTWMWYDNGTWVNFAPAGR